MDLLDRYRARDARIEARAALRRRLKERADARNARRATRLSPEASHRQQEVIDAMTQTDDELQATQDEQDSQLRAAQAVQDAVETHAAFPGGCHDA